MDFLNEVSNLKNQITATRAKMNDLWSQRGYTDPDVLEVSIELDQLINQYQQWMVQNRNQTASKL